MREEDVKGRKRRVRKVGIVEAMMRTKMERRSPVKSFSLRDLVGIDWKYQY